VPSRVRNREWTRICTNKDARTNRRWTQIYADNISFDHSHCGYKSLEAGHFFCSEIDQSFHCPTPKNNRNYLSRAEKLHLICVNLRPSAIQVFLFRAYFASIRVHSRFRTREGRLHGVKENREWTRIYTNKDAGTNHLDLAPRNKADGRRFTQIISASITSHCGYKSLEVGHFFCREIDQSFHCPTPKNNRNYLSRAERLRLICVNLRPSAVQVFLFRAYFVSIRGFVLPAGRQAPRVKALGLVLLPIRDRDQRLGSVPMSILMHLTPSSSSRRVL
jgi:hypothetical protein